jgi:NADH-ubiquinone oxidoreductase chain 5
MHFHNILLIVAILTMFIAGINAVNECDIKKIIALSTLSQLGVITASLAIAQPYLTLFHLLTHALFKALLFVCAGGLIYFFSHTQDIRQFGNTSISLPLTSSCILIANLALIGTPFLAGFYSKDLILEFCLFSPFNLISTSLFMAATLLTAIYSTRFLIYTSLSTPISFPFSFTHDTKKNLNTPITALTIGAIIRGAALN